MTWDVNVTLNPYACNHNLWNLSNPTPWGTQNFGLIRQDVRIWPGWNYFLLAYLYRLSCLTGWWCLHLVTQLYCWHLNQFSIINQVIALHRQYDHCGASPGYAMMGSFCAQETSGCHFYFPIWRMLCTTLYAVRSAMSGEGEIDTIFYRFGSLWLDSARMRICDLPHSETPWVIAQPPSYWGS